MASTSSETSPEIVFFDVETTFSIPNSPVRYPLLEFGAILVCPRRLVEIGSYSTLVRPSNLAAITDTSFRCNGITREAASKAPYFAEVAGNVFEVLNGRVWAGHNIERFDCLRIKEAFAEISRPAPEPKCLIDTLPLLTRTFGRRAGNMKMTTMASYFGLGQQRHRSIDDVRMNLEILKYCATITFLEANVPDAFSIVNLAHENTADERNNFSGRVQQQPTTLTVNDLFDVAESSAPLQKNSGLDAHLESPDKGDNSPHRVQQKSTISTVNDVIDLATSVPLPNNPNLNAHLEPVRIDSPQRDTSVLGILLPTPNEVLCENSTASECTSRYSGFLEPDRVMPEDISASTIFSYPSGHKILLLYKECPLQLCCLGLRVYHGVNAKLMDHCYRPKLNIVVEIPEKLFKLFDTCDQVAFRTSRTSGSNSQWVSLWMHGNSNPRTVRLHIPITTAGDAIAYSTEIYQKDPFGNIQRLSFGVSNAAQFHSLFDRETIIDACFCTDIYDFQQQAGIRLVAKRIVLQFK